MSILSDIEAALGSTAYTTKQSSAETSVEMDITLLSSSIDALADVEDVLPASPTYSELDVALTNGQTVSLYGYENWGGSSENVLIYLIDHVDYKWAHVFQYASNADYLEGKDTQVPAMDLRV